MATIAQIEANRRNARKSTGPRTTAGKARSSRNGLRHGLTARVHVITPEETGAFQVFVAHWIAEINPTTPEEHGLAERLAVISWLLLRCPAREAAIFTEGIQKIHSAVQSAGMPIGENEELMAQVFLRDCEGPHEFLNLIRYERTLDNQFHSCRQDLSRLQHESAKRTQLAAQKAEKDGPAPRAMAAASVPDAAEKSCCEPNPIAQPDSRVTTCRRATQRGRILAVRAVSAKRSQIRPVRFPAIRPRYGRASGGNPACPPRRSAPS